MNDLTNQPALPADRQINQSSQQTGGSTTSQLSKHLFWEIAQEKIDPDRNARWLIQRVLEYGVMDDWRWIKKYYGIPKIAEEAKKMKSLEPRALNFIASISNTPIKKFRCYTLRQSSQKHWIY